MTKVTRTAANPGGDAMHVDTDQFAALARQVEALAAEVAELREDALTIKTLHEMREQRLTERGGRPTIKALKMQAAVAKTTAGVTAIEAGPRPRHLRHLQPVDDGA